MTHISVFFSVKLYSMALCATVQEEEEDSRACKLDGQRRCVPQSVEKMTTKAAFIRFYNCQK